MSRFKSTVFMSPVDHKGRYWRIERALVYYSDILGRTITVPRGFICDLNSMPRLTWIISPKTDYPAAGALHDWGYRDGNLSQADADALYREVLLLQGLSPARANTRYYALRTFGRFSYPGKAPVVEEQ